MNKITAAIGFAAVLMAAGAQAATINVGGKCSIFRAIVSANNDLSPRGFCPPGRGADTINLPANKVFTLTRVNSHFGFAVSTPDGASYRGGGNSGLPVVRSRITINGNKSLIGRSPRSPEFPIFTVQTTGNLTLNDIRLRGILLEDNVIGDDLIFNAGQLTVNRSTLFNAGDSGVDNLGTAIIRNSTLAQNFFAGVESFGALTVEDSTIAFGIWGILVRGSNAYVSLSRNLVLGNENAGIAASDDSTPFLGCRFNLVDDALGNGCESDASNTIASTLIQRIISPRLLNGVYPLNPGSPAIDAVNDGTGCSPTDQRGVVRPQDGNQDGGPACDIGAFEFVP